MVPTNSVPLLPSAISRAFVAPPANSAMRKPGGSLMVSSGYSLAGWAETADAQTTSAIRYRAVRIRAGVLLFVELQRQRIDAVAQARGLRPILEDVAEVGVALRAQHLGPAHAMARVDLGGHGLLVQRLPEARPAAAGFEFGVRAEELGA